MSYRPEVLVHRRKGYVFHVSQYVDIVGAGRNYVWCKVGSSGAALFVPNPESELTPKYLAFSGLIGSPSSRYFSIRRRIDNPNWEVHLFNPDFSPIAAFNVNYMSYDIDDYQSAISSDGSYFSIGLRYYDSGTYYLHFFLYDISGNMIKHVSSSASSYSYHPYVHFIYDESLGVEYWVCNNKYSSYIYKLDGTFIGAYGAGTIFAAHNRLPGSSLIKIITVDSIVVYTSTSANLLDVDVGWGHYDYDGIEYISLVKNGREYRFRWLDSIPFVDDDGFFYLPLNDGSVFVGNVLPLNGSAFFSAMDGTSIATDVYFYSFSVDTSDLDTLSLTEDTNEATLTSVSTMSLTIQTPARAPMY